MIDNIAGPSPSRRAFLATGATGVGGVAVGAAASTLLRADSGHPASSAADRVASLGTAAVATPFPHQAGISVPATQQGHGTVAAFDLVPGADAGQLKALMQSWTAAIADLTAGRTPSGDADTTALGS